MKIKECKTCVDFLYNNPGIFEATEFVMIVMGYEGTTQDAIIAYLSAFHSFDHDRKALDQWIWSEIE